MAKVLFENNWYDELSPTGVYETVYEGMVKAHAPNLWPRFHGVHFKSNVYAGAEGATPDFALVEHNYTEWWIVEVELAHHSFESVVLPQVRKLAEAKYGDEEAEKLHKACGKLDLAKVKLMLKEHQPRVLVVVNKPKLEWIKPLANFDAVLAVFEVFQSDDGKRLFRVNGEHPIGPAEIISICRPDDLMRRWLRVETPAGLRVPHGHKIFVVFNDHITEWDRFADSGKVWLYPPNGPNPLSDKFDYELIRRGDAQFMFREIPRNSTE